MKQNDNGKTISGKGVFPSKYAYTLLFPGRRLILSPKKLIQQIKPKKNSTILEVGQGPGYFSIDVSRSIPDGKLILFDIQQEMLDKARKRLEKNKMKNVEFVKSDGKNFPFLDDHFDIIFMVTVLGEVEERETYLREFHRILKKNGSVAITEQMGDPDIIRSDELIKMFEENGFKVKERFESNLYYTMIFGK